jgi:hypothetical protein
VRKRLRMEEFMTGLAIDNLTRAQLRDLVTLVSEPDQPELWEGLSRGDLTEKEQRTVMDVVGHLRRSLRFNEATLFARAIRSCVLRC